MSSPYNIRKTGALHTLEHRVFIEERNEILSPFHDIPLYPDEKNKDILNMVVEIPRWTNAKLEISRDDVLNPIKQDSKKDAKAVPRPRFVRNCFPHKGYLWNYGAFPRTWEDPFHEHPDTKAFGDNDPLDVCEIGESVGYTGQVKQVKVLGVMALLDEGETDWKVIVIDIKDNLASKINDIEDVERNLPGLLRATNEWFRIYKIPDSNKENQFAFTGECKNKSYANNVIAECHEAWQKLIKGEVPGLTQGKAPYFLVGKKPHESKEFTISIANRKLEGTPGHITAAPQVGPHEELPPAPMNHEFHRVTDGREWTDVIDVDKWFFISGASPSSTA